MSFFTSAATVVLQLLVLANPSIPPLLIMERQRLISIMVLTSIFNRHPPYSEPDYDAALIENALDMATAALVTPVGKVISEMRAKGFPT